MHVSGKGESKILGGKKRGKRKADITRNPTQGSWFEPPTKPEATHLILGDQKLPPYLHLIILFPTEQKCSEQEWVS